MIDKHATYATAVRWTANGPIRIAARPEPRKSWLCRLIDWLKG